MIIPRSVLVFFGSPLWLDNIVLEAGKLLFVLFVGIQNKILPFNLNAIPCFRKFILHGFVVFSAKIGGSLSKRLD